MADTRESSVVRRVHRGGPTPDPDAVNARLDRVQVLMDRGLKPAAIAAELGIALQTAKCYAVKVRQRNGTARKVTRTNGPLAVRLAAKTDTNGPMHPDLGTRCHVFTAATNHEGYGLIHDTRGEYGPKHAMIQAHRAAWMVANGPLPIGIGLEGPVVRHKCDNPICVNPEHLELGTQLENMRDCFTRGGNRVRAVLDEEKVREIRRRYAAGDRQVDIARALGISDGNVRLVVTGRTWRHVA